MKTGNNKAYEKQLATLASRIILYETKVAVSRSRSRRFQGVVTLYTSVLYVFYLVTWILFFARNQLNPSSWIFYAAPIPTAPIFIYFSRQLISQFFARQITRQTSIVNTLRAEQNEKIEEYKSKTNFYSTKNIIDKYEKQATISLDQYGDRVVEGDSSGQKAQHGVRQRPNSNCILHSVDVTGSDGQDLRPPVAIGDHFTSFASSSRTVSATSFDADISHSKLNDRYPVHWYDRLLDIIVGEDESNEKSRYALEQKLIEKDSKLKVVTLENLSVLNVRQ